LITFEDPKTLFESSYNLSIYILFESWDRSIFFEVDFITSLPVRSNSLTYENSTLIRIDDEVGFGK